MKKLPSIFLLAAMIALQATVFAQEHLTTAGFQFKPIIPIHILDNNTKSTEKNGINYNVDLYSGFTGGMVVRHGMTRRLSFETGISYTRRNYRLKVGHDSVSNTSEFRIIGYEVPLIGMVFIQLGPKIFMSTAFGISLDIFPSQIYNYEDSLHTLAIRTAMFIPGLIANLGYEYRTEKSGYFYLGASYHRPFNNIYDAYIKSDNYTANGTVQTQLTGNYLTLDFRYFFHAEPPAKKVKKAKKPKSE